jgi:hypothetical protein
LTAQNRSNHHAKQSGRPKCFETQQLLEGANSRRVILGVEGANLSSCLYSGHDITQKHENELLKVEILMFVIHTRVLDEKAVVVSTGFAADSFQQRRDAEQHLDKLVAQSQPNAGHDSRRCIWWTQENRIVTVYTISP